MHILPPILVNISLVRHFSIEISCDIVINIDKPSNSILSFLIIFTSNITVIFSGIITYVVSMSPQIRRLPFGIVSGHAFQNVPRVKLKKCMDPDGLPL